MTEDEMVGWHHQLNGHEFEQAPEVGDGQGSLACCSPRLQRVGHDRVTEQQLLSSHLSIMSSFTNPYTYFLDFPNLLFVDLFPSGSKQGSHNVSGYVLLVCFT